MNCKVKLRYFTLVEILLVIGIIVMITGLTGLNIHRLYQEQKYTAEVNRVLDTLRIAQDLMMILQTDVSVQFKQNDKDSIIEWAIHFDKPPSKGWVNILAKHHPPLKAIKTLAFTTQNAPIGIPQVGINLNFFSRGSVMSKGTLQLSPYENEHVNGPLNRFICLRGYPAPISIELDVCEFESETNYLTRLTDITKREVEMNETQ